MVKTEDISMPGFSMKDADNIKDYSVRIMKCNLSDATELAELESVLTRCLEGKDFVLLDYDKFTFMDKYIVVIRYMEKRAT